VLAEAFALPGPDERDYLLAGMARLIRQRGPEALLAAPLLLPAPEFWPDPVPPRGSGAAVLLRRLLSYAGLGDLGVEIEIGASRPRNIVHESDDPDDPLRHAAGWFMGIEDGVCRFGLSESSLRDEEMLIGTLGHEVAHAYRDHHGLMVVSRDTEEQLTDLTTVYLGFGFFTLQSSFQFKTGHYDEGGQQLLFERQALGYLRPGQLALLLSAQLVLRKDGRRELEQVLDALAPNHADAVRRAYFELEPERQDLREKLGLPATDAWPEPVHLADAVRPLGPAVIRVADDPAEHREWESENKIAFRVLGDRGVQGGAVGALAGFLSFLVGAGLLMWLLLPGLAVVGYQVGRRLRRARCSSCDHAVSLQQDFCKFCDTPLVGVVDDINDRLEAEERYRAD